MSELIRQVVQITPRTRWALVTDTQFDGWAGGYPSVIGAFVAFFPHWNPTLNGGPPNGSRMSDNPDGADDEGDEEQSFRDRVEEIRQQREEGDEAQGPGGGMEEMMGGGMGGNPFAQMMGGMMGGGPGGGGMGGAGGSGPDSEALTRELGRLREELRVTNERLERIATAIEND